MTNKIKELRRIVPVPMHEALQLLKANDGDVEKCVYLFKAKSIKEICEQTGCDEQTAAEYYEAEKFDINRAVSNIKEDIYDKNYQPIDGVTKENIGNILQWLRVVEAEDFGISLDYQLLDKALETLSLIPSLNDIATKVKAAKQAKDLIFEGYTDADSLEDFVRRHRKLDDDKDFIEANRIVSLGITVIKEELLRHVRNLN
ncbi:MAG: hypothetical protein LBT43_05425 [Prevotella sp.]|jgi:hypothetical protein|uniref:hypothetical protein n=1 Tax=Dysgonomonas sp. GY75 TaxID=2780419 RepID=UPI001883C120|nr:hypothetical protein [Dysgonomonas sp. GY75]MBF0648357.1 hypothetical protein [Dysgonomonas sp. GY75]MDR1501879.1 hypothetical protein [Prevotella sp.]